MPKRGSKDGSSPQHDDRLTHRELSTALPTPDAKNDAVIAFSKQHNLHQKLAVLQKASLLLQDGPTPNEIPSATAEEVEALEKEQSQKWLQPWPVYLVVLATASGAVGQGWAQTSMNGANLYLPTAFGLQKGHLRDDLILGLVNSAIYLSNGLLGAWLVAPLNARLGRRGAVLVAATVSFLGNAAGGIAQSWIQLLVFRLVLGCALGIISTTLNILLAESVPASIRGGLAVSWQLFCAFGIFIGFVTNAAAYNLGPNTWRWQLAAPAVSTIPLFILVLLCTESPSWQIKNNNRYDLAFFALRKLRNTEIQAARDLYQMYLQSTILPLKSTYITTLAELFTVPRIRRATLAAYSVMICQQLCGINIISFYSSSIFVDADFSSFGALLASVAFGFVNFIGALPAIWTMDTFGRRSLLLLTLPMMALTMFVASLSFALAPSNPAHFVLLSSMIYLFCAEYSPGMGPIPAAYSAEVFPLSHRELGTSSAVAMTNIWATALSLTFPALLTALGSQGTFMLYAGLNVLALLLVFFFIPETKKLTLEELDATFNIPTATFIKYQTNQYVPWFIRRYVLWQHKLDAPLLHHRHAYSSLEQEDDEF